MIHTFFSSRARWLLPIVALLAGSLITLSLAPFNFWVLGIVSPVVLSICLVDRPRRQRFFLAFIFGIGLFGSGASWVYVAIHDFAYTPMLLALVMTALFVGFLAVVFALPLIFYSPRFANTLVGKTLGFSALWVLGEWSRSWLLTGFPWLYLGYAHIDTWLSGWAPVWGVFGLSFMAVLSGTLLYRMGIEPFMHKQFRAAPFAVAMSVLLALWGGGFGFSQISWGEKQAEQTISVAIIQPNIPLELKWDSSYREAILKVLRAESDKHWDKDLQVWPEAAIPMMFHDAEAFLLEIDQRARQTDTGVISGILYDDLEKFDTYYNSIVGLGRAESIYFKQRLVPFGEYVPLEQWLRGLIRFFDLPNSVIFPGPKNQDILGFDKLNIAPSICYEIVYPDLVAELAREASLLVTISNDAWFGDSIGPMQHFQMARMRAVENQRYVIRATNTGLSGVIDAKGKVVLQGQQFIRQSIAAENIVLDQNRTPFSYWRSLPVILMCGLICLLVWGGQLLRRQRSLVGIPG